ncbi:DUF3298 domain-containing protein [Chengkuizengella axinellae]|uniref:DUF3298 domain-containing protein n=1 Tax=Chengkuizengella axinellae TaxID=3064388 RepID=A0ABT9J2L3_9BACL|nr:DUF3298 domain-containing protein [Chengkuizengella sp. 2205SS18-9]MDP5275854.1 DUF3298 domain-containing protein [Chengkuizengella sp. 2205SS18-9]
MKKTALILTLSGTLLLGGIQPSLANSTSTVQPAAIELTNFDLQELSKASVQPTDYSFENEYVTVTGNLPEVKGLKDEQLQKEVNEQIKLFVEQKTAEVEKESKVFNDEQKALGDDAISGPHESPTGPYYLNISYEAKISGNMISIVFNTYTMGYIAANGINETDSINIIDGEEGHVLELDQFVSDKEKLNELIQKEIEATEYLFNDEFESIRADQAYYVEHNQLNVVFNEYEIAAGYVGTPTVTIPLEQLEIADDFKKSNITVESKKISFEDDLVVISGELPVLKGIADEELQKSVEEQIEEIYQTAKDEIEKEANELIENKIDTRGSKLALEMTYDVKVNQDMVSIIMTTSKYTLAGSGISLVQSINILNDVQGKQIQLDDIVKDQDQLVKLIQEEIDQDPEKYFQQELTSIREDIAFYTEGDQLVLIFNEYEIAAGYVGTPVMKLALSELSVESDHGEDEEGKPNEDNKISYYTKTVGEDEVEMVSLRDLGKHFDFKIKWDPKTKSVVLTKDALEISVRVGDNKAIVADESVELDAVVESYKNKVYVPVSFAEKVLGENVLLDEKNEISIKK